MSVDDRRPLDRVFIGRDDVELQFTGRHIRLVVGGDVISFVTWSYELEIETALTALEEQLVIAGFAASKRDV
jgi:hypothetical protein